MPVCYGPMWLKSSESDRMRRKSALIVRQYVQNALCPSNIIHLWTELLDCCWPKQIENLSRIAFHVRILLVYLRQTWNRPSKIQNTSSGERRIAASWRNRIDGNLRRGGGCGGSGLGRWLKSSQLGVGIFVTAAARTNLYFLVSCSLFFCIYNLAGTHENWNRKQIQEYLDSDTRESVCI